MTALRTYARYMLPLTLASLLAFLPVWLLVRRGGPIAATDVRRILRLVWVIAGGAWIIQLAVVGAAAPLVGERISQLRAAAVALNGLARAALPCAAAAGAVLIGGVALVVPGLVLLVLLSLTGASQAAGLPAPLHESVAVARRAPLRLAAIVAAMLVVDLAIAAIALRVPEALGKKATLAQLAGYRRLLPNLVIALALVTPVFACALAAFYRRHAESAPSPTEDSP